MSLILDLLEGRGPRLFLPDRLSALPLSADLMTYGSFTINVAHADRVIRPRYMHAQGYNFQAAAAISILPAYNITHRRAAHSRPPPRRVVARTTCIIIVAVVSGGEARVGRRRRVDR